ncbi:Glu S.griseus protease inhibitor [Mizuhopecten yessoensis]|uniref:Glu S.griseus protease inhibitor n=1 Tax=Mizuhopecten yessoensis TaxID=6573 RepID=A0A210PKM6_MIZYE|nr:Glu S.griseus protease inhibitor [Mizuhopecten yessoensis]
MSICQGKYSWPELVGVSGEVAVKVIEKENSLVTAFILPINQPVGGPFFCNRVRVFVDADGIVVVVPVIG